MPWMLKLTERRFGTFDTIGAEGWFTGSVLQQHGMYLPIRTADAYLIALVNAMPWAPTDLEVVVLLLVTDEDAVWQGVQLLRASIAWARSRGVAHWRYYWDHGNAGILARRVGAKPDTQRYVIHLR